MNLDFQCSQCRSSFNAQADDVGDVVCPHCGWKANLFDLDYDLPGGYRLAGFEIIRKIGAGSTGAVYLATQLSMQRVVAVKVLFKAQTRNSASLQQFLNEIKTLGQIQHPNIVTAFESGEEHGMHFLVMQYVPGVTLESMLQKGKIFHSGEALSYVMNIAEALKYVWNKYRMCHRDIKPGNIILDEETQTPMLLDFGIALRRGENAVCNGLVEGSPFYMSPEQCRGEELSFSSDIYSLGATLYHLLVGVPPYDNPNDVADILRMHCEAPFPDPQSRNPNVELPENLQNLMHRMMAKNPLDRFDSWESFLNAAEKVKVQLERGASKGSSGKAHTGAKTHGTAASKPRAKLHSSPVVAPRKKKSPWIVILNLLFFLMLSAGSVYYLMSKNNNAKAQTALEDAQRIFEKTQAEKCELEESVKRWQNAVALSKAQFVKTDLVQQIQSEAEEDIALLNRQIQEKKQVKELHQEFLDVYGQIEEELAKVSIALKKRESPDPQNLLKLGSSLNAVRKKLAEFPVLLASSREAILQDINAIKAIKESIDSTYKEAKKRLSEDAAQEALRAKLAKMQEEQEKREAEEAAEEEAEEAAEAEAEAERERAQKEAEKKQAAAARQQAARERLHNQQITDLYRTLRSRKYEDARKKLDQWIKDTKAEEDGEYQKFLTGLKPRLLRLQKIMKNVPSSTSTKAEKLQMRQAIPNESELYEAFLFHGHFMEAKQIMPQSDEEVFHTLAAAYMQSRVSSAYYSMKKNKNNSRAWDKLEAEFKNLKEYQDAVEELRSK